MMKFLFKNEIVFRIKTISIIFISCFLLSACTLKTVGIRNTNADFVSNSNNFTKRLVKGGDFWITTYQRITNKNLPYVFYIEGDGLSFIGRYNVSDNPTPTYPMMLKLAALDPRPNIVYIARLCQYTPMHLNPKCDQSYWTDKRMSSEAVNSINEVIETLNNGQKFSLIGFSGGGGIAVLIAEINNHVKDIITIAANLDHVSFNKYHNAKPMLSSLNPIDYASKIRNVPQLHISGGYDKIVPPFIADNYVRKSSSMCVHQSIFDVAYHQKGWENLWKYILTLPLTCYKN